MTPDNESLTQKTTRNGRSELITLRVPLELLPHINDYVTATGNNRTWLLLEGAKRLMQQAGTIEG